MKLERKEMKLKHYLKAKKEAIHPSKISFRNIYAVFQAFFRNKQKCIAGCKLDEHIYEQIIWRRIEVINNSPKCWYSGSCKVCGCDILGKTMEDRACSIIEHPDLLSKRSPCYPAMMKEKEWKEYKKLKTIKLFD